ncbi:MAG: 4Fe-4S binding protein [Paludibacteraceae bacterium]|nr:4Fe-4S binding protein [Paludibacteraceae bacterium]
MIRDIIKIDRDKCNGCGVCVPNCHEGALQMIDSKATLVSELMCDGLGACVGHCPEGAITIERREAEQYDEIRVIKQMIPQGLNVVIAHLTHLKEHNEVAYLKEAVGYLKIHEGELGFDLSDVVRKVHPVAINKTHHTDAPEHKHVSRHIHTSACPSAKPVSLVTNEINAFEASEFPSELQQWPVQLHLINPVASYFNNADLLIAADCSAYTYGGFHQKFLRGRKLIIACPKLDTGTDTYVDKISTLIDQANINTITVLVMEVPCCSGLMQIVRKAQNNTTRKVPVKLITISIKGQILSDEWV